VTALCRGRAGYGIVVARYDGSHEMGVVMCRACILCDGNNHCISEAFGHFRWFCGSLICFTQQMAALPMILWWWRAGIEFLGSKGEKLMKQLYTW